ncbi:MAG: LCP family protein [Thermomicrobiales bacterium]
MNQRDIIQGAFSRRRLLAGSLGSALMLGLDGRLGSFDVAAQDQEIEPADLSAVTLVVGGLDTRTVDQPENTDVLKIVRVDLVNGFARVISIPRDLYCEIPGYAVDKITRAYDYGAKAAGGEVKPGLQAVRATITHNFGVETDGAVFVTFDGFIRIVDAVGGIDVNNPYDVYDGEYPTFDYGIKEIYYPAGWNHLNGEQALEFSRTRHQDGDDGRVMRQELVLRGLVDKVQDPPIAEQAPDLIREYRGTVRTDLGRSKQLALALAAPQFSNDSVSFATVNAYLYPDTAPNGAWIYSGDWSQLPGFVQSFLNGA